MPLPVDLSAGTSEIIRKLKLIADLQDGVSDECEPVLPRTHDLTFVTVIQKVQNFLNVLPLTADEKQRFPISTNSSIAIFLHSSH